MNALSTDIVTRIRNHFPDVELVQLSGDGTPTHHWGIKRCDTGEFFGPAVRQGYVPHTTEDICALVEACEPVLGRTGDVQMGWHGGHTVMIQPEDEHIIEATKNDTVFPRVIVKAVYGQVFTATLGMYRSLCTNLSMFHQIAGMTVKIRHTTGLRSKMGDLIEDFHLLSGRVDDMAVAIKQMVDNKVRLADYLNEIYPMPSQFATDRQINSHRRRTEQIIRRIQNERARLGMDGDLQEVTGWEAFNGVQGYIQHDQRRRNNPGTFTRAMLALTDPRVAQAQHLAIAMSA